MKDIEKLRLNFGEWYNAGRFDDLGNGFYEENALAIPPNCEPIRGSAKIAEYFR